MLTPREVAASAWLRTRGMPRHVLGNSPEANEALRHQRVAQLTATLRLLRAAPASARFLASEWDDDALEAAAVAVERQLAAETAQLAPN